MRFEFSIRCVNCPGRNLQFRGRPQLRRNYNKRNFRFTRRQVLQLSVLSWIFSRRDIASAAEDLQQNPLPPPTLIESYELTEAEAERLMKEEEDRRKQKKSRKGRIRELEDTQAELAEKELELLQKEQELRQKDQSLLVLQEEVSYQSSHSYHTFVG